MKFSYKILKKYLPYIKSAKEVANDLIMHTAEVEEIIKEWENLEKVFSAKILEIKKHPNSERLNLCIVDVLWEKKQIVCWAPNVKAWLIVAVATVWAKLKPDFEIKKTKIRWETSEWMICSLDELGLTEERQEWIWEMPQDTPLWISLRDYLEKNDEILEIDNKAINHRPDMFSYMWVLREIAAINEKTLDLDYKKQDFYNLKPINVKNSIPEVVRRYSLLWVNWVWNIKSSQEIETIINASGNSPKWLLIDVSNYCLYFYWQPAHIFDADKINWTINVRYAIKDEEFEALNWVVYKLDEKDIVIADEEKILALWWIIWWKEASVSDDTKNILIETAHFDQSVLRMTWKRLWIRTDSLNVFEKDTIPEMCDYATTLILDELRNNYPNLEITWYFDSKQNKKENIKKIPFDVDFINNLLWSNFEKDFILNILNRLGISLEWNDLIIPFWRKDLTTKSCIAEEVARLSWYDNIKPTIPKQNLWAVIQDNTYKLKNDSRNFFVCRWFFDVYNYSFVNKELLEKLWMDISECIPLKNFLSLDATHLRNSLIPNLMLWLQENIRNFNKDLKLFEVEKVFFKNNWEVWEKYMISWVLTSDKDIVYYDLQSIISDFLESIYAHKFYFDVIWKTYSFAHKTRTSKIIVWWKEVWVIWEIHPLVSSRFDIKKRVWFFEINLDLLKDSCYSITKANELSAFQENNFDLSFVVWKDVKWRDIKNSILNTDKKIIKKVELFDIYENSEKLPWKRSLSFKIFIQSDTETLWDDVKNKLISDIVEKVKQKWWVLRQ